MRLSDDELRSALRAEAAAHRPDREAMLDRITATAMNVEPAPRGSRVRVAAAAAAVVALFAGGGVANWALAGDSDPAPVPAPTAASPVPPSPTPALSSSPSLSPSPQASLSPSPQASPSLSRKAATTPPASKSQSPSATATAGQSPLWADGSVDPDGGASVITVKTTTQLTALEVVVRVARTEGLTSRGGTKQTPGASVSTTVTEEADALVYRFVLSSADVLAPGTYTFIAKYAHSADGRDAGADTYQATATSADGTPLQAAGDFY
jgi:hypothetical protein